VTNATLFVTAALSTGQNTRNDRVALDVAYLAGSVLGNTMQVWGAFTAPARDPAVGTRALSLAPGCAPTAGGFACGALAHF
jgi:hypothetical protein